MPETRTRGRAGIRVLFAGSFLLTSIVIALALCRGRPEKAPGLVPDPVAPFGVIARDKLEFRWLLPEDGAPVRVDVLGATGKPLWSSKPSVTGSLRPSQTETARWPLDDLVWRPVAVPEKGQERPGSYAAFTLVP
jgi:hypothetical protein